jgi:tRNA-dihydrouridine synthase B
MSKIVNSSGVEILIIHARTVMSNYQDGALDLETVKRLKEKLSIPLVGNGNITSPLSAKKFIDYTRVDALMIGRESMGNPKIFNQIHEYLSNGDIVPFINSAEIVRNHLKIYEKIIDDLLESQSYPYAKEDFKFTELKRNSIWLTKDMRNSTKIRTILSKTKNLEQLRTTFNAIFN